MARKKEIKNMDVLDEPKSKKSGFFAPFLHDIKENAIRFVKDMGETYIKEKVKKYAIFLVLILASTIVFLIGVSEMAESFFNASPGVSHIILAILIAKKKIISNLEISLALGSWIFSLYDAYMTFVVLKGHLG